MAKLLFEKTYPFGFIIYKYEDDAYYTITGNIKKDYMVKNFSSNYDVEEYIQKHVDCKGIDFDSEFSQFFADARTEETAVKFCEDVQDWFENVKKLID